MSGVTPLVDTLLATRLGQRVDLVPLKAQAEIAGPGAVTNVEKVGNDVRLPSREALQRQLGAGLTGCGEHTLEFSPARPVGAVTLSATARAVSAVLNLPVGTAPVVRGRAPLLPDVRTPVAVSVLTAVLTRTVAESGLFYESHLLQYAAGQRTLGQLLQEPQAGVPALAFPAARAPVADAGLPLAVALIALPGEADAGPVVPSPGTVIPDTDSLEAKGSWDALTPESAGRAATYGRTGLPDPIAPSVQDFSAQEGLGTQISEAARADTVHTGSPAAAIHPDLTVLVRQQLEMLAAPVFRWGGEGWPGVPMDWEIRQERGEQEARKGREGREGADDLEIPPSTWTTRLTLKLPRLGIVNVRLGLAGAMLQLHMAAAQEDAIAVMTNACAGLSRRFGVVGLELTDVQIVGAASEDGATEFAENEDAG